MSSVVDLADDDRDAHVVEDICGYVTATPPQSFFLFAGAGSGKTRTLVEVLRRITGVVEHTAGREYAARLRARGQSVRVITFTKNATAVVNARLGENILTSVSTIHAFCWGLIKGFDDDIREALLAVNAAKLAEQIAEAKKKKRGESDSDRAKYAELEAAAEGIRNTPVFIYTPDYETYGEGALSHSAVLDASAWLIQHRPTMQQILVDRHPLIFIDESQDTMKQVLDALFVLSAVHPGAVTLGLIGDHRQRIYGHGHDDLPSLVPVGWQQPALQMNHRSQRRIVDLINKIWDADIVGRTQPKTGVRQHPRSEKKGGFAHIFVGHTGTDTAVKIQKEHECAAAMVTATGDMGWHPDLREYKTLSLEHKLAATRGEFLEAFVAMELLDKDAATPKSNGDRSGPAIVRPVLGAMQELAACIRPDRSLDELAAMDVLRSHRMLENLPAAHSEREIFFDKIHAAALRFGAAVCTDDATVRDVLKPVIEDGLFKSDARLVHAYYDKAPLPPEPKSKSAEAKEDRRRRGFAALFGTPWRQIGLYSAYLGGEAELATHQVVKGSEFKRVMVVMDDGDAAGNMISYDKLIGGSALGKGDLENVDAGNETTIDRSLRLLYVTCSRAEESLALVLWAKDPDAALSAIKKSNWFVESEISDLR
jgi:DNA helicase-2/ATP-dependent DNA helicase PcrA